MKFGLYGKLPIKWVNYYYFLLILFNASKLIGLTFMDVGVCVADWCLLTELALTTVFVLFVYSGASLNYLMNNMASFRVGE